MDEEGAEDDKIDKLFFQIYRNISESKENREDPNWFDWK